MSSSWITPPGRTELIENLVSGVDRYNPSNIGILEDYLYHQLRSGEYDCLANLAILKLYQFNPDLYNADVVINVLLKALTTCPGPDFNLCISLLDDRPPNSNIDEPDTLPSYLPILRGLHDLLFRCRFPAFWAVYRSSQLEALRENYTVEVAGFEDAIREVAVHAIKATFTSIGVSRLLSYLDLEGDELPAFLRKHDWTLDASTNAVRIPPMPNNQIEATVVQENTKLSQLTKIIAYSAAAY
ncbi:ARM repeat-containing protein [Fistulina hepatica ATCC 64428]|uniref:Eukaryotic translation initiation factor 3 subunit K n=1 Tax=Fistulina hepatica ATCC 64428 TaxID=1128425 RepID=A0A0D7A3P3_9AGAR|nr:ARM repeat-containing protein [Fistulina hepatica ATCC 64428]